MNWDIVISIVAAMFAADGVIGLFWGGRLQRFFGKINIRVVAVVELVIAAVLIFLRFGI